MDTVTSTRSRILEAAVELFGARGVDAVSLDEIAVAVGVRKQTVLYWFANKDELVDAVFAEALAQLSVAIEAAVRAAPDEPLDRVDSIVSA
ncbi:MAG TPA: TetR/AcrR family transcriptional regulator, partial [Ilumatobacteraceae bacterium]